MSQLLEAYDRVLETIETTARSGHLPVPQLLIVSKNQPPEMILPLLKRGHRLFGENRVQEAMHKWTSLRHTHPDIKLHLIGPLQRNKISDALGLFDIIETIDRPNLVDVIVDFQLKFPHKVRTTNFLIQVNIGREPQKSGVNPECLGELYSYCCSRGMLITGLMCIPPAHEPSVLYFEQMRQLAHEHKLQYLSIGMSHDYVEATKYGSSWVRIGRGIFEGDVGEK